jgi:hypothetical protein
MIAEVPLLDDGVASMAVRAPNLARCHLPLEHGNRAFTAGQLDDPRGLFTDVVEVQDHWIGFTSSDAWMLAEVLE